MKKIKDMDELVPYSTEDVNDLHDKVFLLELNTRFQNLKTAAKQFEMILSILPENYGWHLDDIQDDVDAMNFVVKTLKETIKRVNG